MPFMVKTGMLSASIAGLSVSFSMEVSIDTVTSLSETAWAVVVLSGDAAATNKTAINENNMDSSLL
ncbi:MAG: hypothetical protein A2509_04730 [Candidatus Edwardsbacteria bacterium RIFOXYD12_FULL_50_11]|uniref:Uncharacterized protein n=1 Tax=Candidatus Edwardsbacteria bacterium GWF2_54_11 TaxID=1817851 RepID=A0A1F5RFD8_9BACT|nr:MAG: hypothetical protein A2502_05935 [Candidatus Edwardsbacteria bacterium RifOxyC12_full_54_24]OGF07986.1 MAG: hypothetical protein A2273_05890 [Candidatus Edwardsbacteria bacterium RifOxyA12_full_54_48]OGF10234.1 MAG: hypothetical protein A3K15_12305 [Candidatus Edwardsbacteria bacterium GWE2_54_12]OGF13205.1 MAG: hypothetical protein A2024_09965 [Candidatus Edwardsbacteria bacterium GWF2_54_11]OGF15146.1 MAG: hypothetical protein A2509_04730 [Candidatus Edwardsbacteria bacterium RIFOXYD1